MSEIKDIICDECRKEKAVYIDILHPFMLEIYNKEVRINLCQNCYDEVLLEI